jgi:hypothetical protein
VGDVSGAEGEQDMQGEIGVTGSSGSWIERDEHATGIAFVGSDVGNGEPRFEGNRMHGLMSVASR